ncbi:hypothetical protein WN944_019357 [Citrus x changshan-huyou]|uniref:Uncharacterized protein n=1 Tax=Citrus x changshan-huyou TaxID=2935761 RepID=A0AAP0LV39_9ROSI
MLKWFENFIRCHAHLDRCWRAKLRLVSTMVAIKGARGNSYGKQPGYRNVRVFLSVLGQSCWRGGGQDRVKSGLDQI